MESAKYASQPLDSLEMVAPIGSRTVVHLSDGSEIHLNYGSKLKYPQKFVGDSRDVILTGEGFFNVAHNPEMPFIVKTEQLNVIALGTKFNVFVVVPSMPENSLGRKMVLLANWNEFGEGHFLMPSSLAGFGYVDALREVFTNGTNHADIAPTDAQKKRSTVLYPKE